MCNNSSVLDYIYLEMAYSPLFTAVCQHKDTQKFGFRKLGFFEIIPYAMGLKFPIQVGQNELFDDLKKLRDSQYVMRPVVIFPEATKTNGKGVL